MVKLKLKKKNFDDKFQFTEEEKKLLRENPDNISLMKGILDNLQTQRDMYKIEQTKYCWGNC